MNFRIQVLLLIVLTTQVLQAQFVVAPSTPFVVGKSLTPTNIVIQSTGDVIFTPPMFFRNSNVALHLLGAGKIVNGATRADTISAIAINGTGNYSVTGKWIVKDDLDFQSGNLVTPLATAVADHIVYAGPDLGTKSTGGGSSASYVNGPLFVKGQNGTITFPIGTSTNYLPSQLNNVTDLTAVFGMHTVAGDPGIPADSLSSEVDQVFTNWYWKLSVLNRSTFNGALVSLSLDGAETFLGSERAVVIEKDSLLRINELSGSLNSPYVMSNDNVSAKGGTYAIASSKDISVKIHKLITPNGDGFNETLVVEGIDYYNKDNNPGTSNKVILLDRWGALNFQKDNFKNYSTQVPQQADFDYSKLNNGNYICIVEYVDTSGRTYKLKPQMITVLK